MSKNDSIVITEDGEVLDQSALVPMGDIATLKEAIPYNRMNSIARTTLTRLVWDKKGGTWSCSLGEFSELKIKPVAASELYAVWTETVGRPAYYGTEKPEDFAAEEVELGYRVAFMEENLGPCYSDFFGLTRDFAEGICKRAVNNKDVVIHIKGSSVRNTSNGVFYVPKVAS